jgi:hypothetical protein
MSGTLNDLSKLIERTGSGKKRTIKLKLVRKKFS